MDDIRTWLPQTLRRKNLSYADFARLCHISPSTVSKIISGKMRPSADMCIKMATVLDEPSETLLRQAGILPSIPTSDDAFTVEGLDLLRRMSERKRQRAVRLLRFLYQDDDD